MTGRKSAPNSCPCFEIITHNLLCLPILQFLHTSRDHCGTSPTCSSISILRLYKMHHDAQGAASEPQHGDKRSSSTSVHHDTHAALHTANVGEERDKVLGVNLHPSRGAQSTAPRRGLVTPGRATPCGTNLPAELMLLSLPRGALHGVLTSQALLLPAGARKPVFSQTSSAHV